MLLCKRRNSNICDYFLLIFKNVGTTCGKLKYIILTFSPLFIQGGTDLIINSYGPIIKNNSKKKWRFFQDSKKIKVEQVTHLNEKNFWQSMVHEMVVKKRGKCK